MTDKQVEKIVLIIKKRKQIAVAMRNIINIRVETGRSVKNEM